MTGTVTLRAAQIVDNATTLGRFEPSTWDKSPPADMDLAARIGARRHELGWPRSRVALLAECHQDTVRFVESGRRRPSLKTLVVLSRVLGEDFVGRYEPRTTPETAPEPVSTPAPPAVPQRGSQPLPGCLGVGDEMVVEGRSVRWWLRYDAMQRAQAVERYVPRLPVTSR